MAAYEAVIGMEVHAELLTASKMFCSCRNAFGGEPNTRCCPVCLGMPGSLPVINRRAVEHVIRTALALNCTINPVARFDRKNYFYPDLPKGYQISQYDQPIGVNGWLDIRVDDTVRRVRIRRIHLEEDTGKLMHLPSGDSAVDYNRSGVPLMEIVTDFPPDMRTADEAHAYLVALRAILTYTGVSDGRMEEGSLRCEPNLSIRPVGSDAFGTKTEIKNLNSFRAVQRGIEYEIQRQMRALERGEAIRQETRGWNDARQETVTQRSKEEEQEYRYFPEPDLVPLHIETDWIEQIRASMPELPDQARERLMRDHGIREHEAAWLTQSAAMAAFFTEAAARCHSPAQVAVWMMGDFARLLNASGMDVGQARVTPEQLGELIGLVEQGRISGKMAKAFFERMFATGAAPGDLLAEAGDQITDSDAIAEIIGQVIAAEPGVWSAIVAGDERKLTYVMGQVMKLSRGKANPQETRRLLTERLERER
jgi:aspartyl-tRNA(Asn)/glutamyl-tRNA(Gln) amidotransferase subunit B